VSGSQDKTPPQYAAFPRYITQQKAFSLVQRGKAFCSLIVKNQKVA
jgi:hypothetical protein